MENARKIFGIIDAILLIIIGAFGLYAAFDGAFLSTVGGLINNNNLFVGVRLALLIVSLVVFIIALVGLFTSPKKDKNMESIKIESESGTISISAITIKTLARLQAQEAEDIFDIRADVIDNEGKPVVEVRAKVPPTVSIPDISVKLQSDIRNKILTTTGTDVESIRIMIDGIVDTSKNNSVNEQKKR